MIFDGVVTGVIESVGKIASDLITTDKERGDQAIEMRRLDIEEQKVEAGLMANQTDVAKVEAAHPSVFVAGARPAVMWVGAISLAWTFVAHPVLMWVWALGQAQGWIGAGVPSPPTLDASQLFAIITGMLGIGGMRSYDKAKGTATERVAR